MKYGMRERISGALVLIALAVIFVPMLLDDPAPREDRPQPVLTIEQPVDVEQNTVDEPTAPDSLDQQDTASSAVTESETEVSESPVESVVSNSESSSTSDTQASDTQASDTQASDTAESSATNESSSGAEQPADDPIAELARAADERQAAATPDGEWAVQVGSFGQASNAEGLQARLTEQGYPAYRRARENNLTTVYVGPYDSSEIAENVMGKLKAGLNLQGLLVRTE